VVSATYFARKKRPKSARRLRDEQLMPLIEQVHAESGGTYGARRITRALRRKGQEVARCTVERLMGELGLEGVIRGRRRRTTVPEPSAPRPPDLVDRDFTASRPDQLWVADMTYVRTWSGWAYVAFVLDVYSRMIVGWQARDRRVPRHRTQQRQERRDQPRDQPRRPQRVRLPQPRQPTTTDTLRNHPPSPRTLPHRSTLKTPHHPRDRHRQEQGHLPLYGKAPQARIGQDMMTLLFEQPGGLCARLNRPYIGIRACVEL
jgi:helix-turn-helix protein/integrase-like protein